MHSSDIFWRTIMLFVECSSFKQYAVILVLGQVQWQLVAAAAARFWKGIVAFGEGVEEGVQVVQKLAAPCLVVLGPPAVFTSVALRHLHEALSSSYSPWSLVKVPYSI